MSQLFGIVDLPFCLYQVKKNMLAFAIFCCLYFTVTLKNLGEHANLVLCLCREVGSLGLLVHADVFECVVFNRFLCFGGCSLQVKACCLLHGQHGRVACEMQDGRGSLLCVILS